MRTTTLVAVLMLTSCFVPSVDHTFQLDGSISTGGNGGGGAGGGGGAQRCVLVAGLNEVVCVSRSPVVCGGTLCASGEVCCQTTGACVAAGSAACPKLPTTWRYDSAGARACGSSADCASDEYCMIDDLQAGAGPRPVSRCIGSGHCQKWDQCPYCGPPGTERCRVCGCDGVTYESSQAACVAGVSVAVSSHGSCGASSGVADAGAFTVACGTSTQCPPGAQCCALTGKCFDASEPWRCVLQPNGTVLDCATQNDCNQGSGGGSGNEPPTTLCEADSCTGPGLCSQRGSQSSCGGEVVQVCGCDGVTYVNACWARAAGARVASAGACP